MRAVATGAAMLLVMIAVMICAAPSAWAADASWNRTSGGGYLWTLSSNWYPAAPPGATSGTTNPDTATFGASITGLTTVTVDTYRNISKITFNNANNYGYTLQTGTLHLTSGGAVTTSGAASGSYTDTISAPIVLEGNYAFTANASSSNGILSIGAVTGAASTNPTLTLNGSNAGNNAITGVIANGASGSVAITKSGAGKWILSNANTYSGVTTVDNGALAITNASALGTAAGNTVVNSGDGSSAGGQLQVSGGITVNEPLTISGQGNLGYNGALRSVSGNNVWSGAITQNVDQSRITVAANSLTITGGISGGQWGLILDPSVAGTTLTVSTNPILLPSDDTLFGFGSGTNVLSASGSTFGQLNVRWNNTFKIGVDNALPTTADLVLGASYSGAESGTFDLNGFSQTVNRLATDTPEGAVIPAGTRKITNSTATSKTLTVGNGGGSSLFDGVIENGSGTVSLTKVGTGTLTLTRANTYTGETVISGGTLLYGIANALASGAVTVNDGGTYNLNGYSDTIGALTVNSGTTGGTVTTGAGTLTLGGNVMSSGGASNASISGKLSVGATAKTFTVSGATSGLTVSANTSGSGGIEKSGAGTLTLSGTNTYSGATTIGEGTVSVSSIGNSGSAGNLGTNATINIGSSTTTGTLAYTGAGESTNRAILLNGTTGGGVIDNSGSGTLTISGGVTVAGGGSKTLTVQGTNSTTLSGIISDRSSSITTSVTMNTSAALTLSGANTYTGVTTLNGGSLVANLLANGGVTSSIGSASSAASNLVFNGTSGQAAQLYYSGGTTSTDRAFTVNGTNNWIAVDNAATTLTLAGASTGSGDFGFYGAGKIYLNANMGHTGWTTILNNLQYGPSGGLTGHVAVGNGGVLDLNGYSDTIGGLQVDAGTVGGQLSTNGGTLTVGGNITTYGAASNATITGTGAGGLNLGGATRNFTVADPAGGLTVSAIVSNGGMTKLGSGTLTLSGNNTYTGTLTVSAGTLDQTGGTNTPSTLTIGSGGTYSVSGGTLTASTINGSSGTFKINTVSANYTLNIPNTLEFAAFNVDNSGSFSLGTKTLTTPLLTIGSGSGFTINGGTVNATDVSGAGTLNLSSGILNLGGVFNGPSFNMTGGTLKGTGDIYTDLVIPVGGTISPGNSPAILDVYGDFALDGTYIAELGGTTPGTGYDQIRVHGGNVTLAKDSLIQLEQLNSFLPNHDESFALIVWDEGYDLTDNGVVYDTGVFAPSNYWAFEETYQQFVARWTGGNQRVPEPGTAVGGIFVLVLLAVRKFMRK